MHKILNMFTCIAVSIYSMSTLYMCTNWSSILYQMNDYYVHHHQFLYWFDSDYYGEFYFLVIYAWFENHIVGNRYTHFGSHIWCWVLIAHSDSHTIILSLIYRIISLSLYIYIFSTLISYHWIIKSKEYKWDER